MLCRHCRVQNTPAEHQNENEVLDTEHGREGGGKEGRTVVAHIRATSDGFCLNCGYKVPTCTHHKVQVICFTALQKTSALPIHIGQILTHLCSSLIAECCHSLNRT